MNYVERAKMFLKQQVQGAALVAVPLAMALGAGEAQGATILPTSAATCVKLQDYIDACSVGTQTAPGGGTTFLAGSLQNVFGQSGYLILDSGGAARVQQSGILNESLSGSIVANYSFRLDFYNYVNAAPISPQQLGVTLSIVQSGGNSYSTVVTSTGTYSGSVTLSNVNLTAGLSTIVSFTIDAPNTTDIALNFPNSGFITFTPVADTPAVPEPRTIGLVGLVLAGVWCVRRR